MAREYARAPKGERAHSSKPASWGRNLTILGALTVDKLDAVMTVTGPTTGEVFTAYVGQVLVPTLEPGQIVVMDNLSSHKVAGIRELIEGAGAELVYLPPYSPDFNPIEQCWSKLKNFLRSWAARTIDQLNDAIAYAMELVSAQDCRNWFKNSGYAESA